jgi:hypothetical protein
MSRIERVGADAARRSGRSTSRIRAGWLSVRSSLLVAAGCLAGSSAWAAAASDLTVNVQVRPVEAAASGTSPETYAVSVRRDGLNSSFAVLVTLTNGSANNTINQVSFSATTTVNGTLAVPASGIAAYAGAIKVGQNMPEPNCPTPTEPAVNTVTCSVGQLSAGEGRQFFVIFSAPLGGTTVDLHTSTDFSSGNSSQTPPASTDPNLTWPRSIDKSIKLITTVTEQVNKHVQTIVGTTGGRFFTGVNGLVDANNKWSTDVEVPQNSEVTDNQIRLFPEVGAPMSYACKPGYYCYGLGSVVDIRRATDGEKLVLTGSDLIVIKLRQDISSLSVKKPVPKLGDVRIYYKTGLESPPFAEEDPGKLLLACSVSPATVDNPCVLDRKEIKTSKGKTLYYEYWVAAKDNGKIGW